MTRQLLACRSWHLALAWERRQRDAPLSIPPSLRCRSFASPATMARIPTIAPNGGTLPAGWGIHRVNGSAFRSPFPHAPGDRSCQPERVRAQSDTVRACGPNQLVHRQAHPRTAGGAPGSAPQGRPPPTRKSSCSTGSWNEAPTACFERGCPQAPSASTWRSNLRNRQCRTVTGATAAKGRSRSRRAIIIRCRNSPCTAQSQRTGGACG